MPKKHEILESVCQGLRAQGLIEGYAYDHFRRSEAVPPPFAVYRRVAPQTFGADDKVYHRGDAADLELYASTPDEMEALMAAAEALIDAEGIYYKIAADTAYIESEDFWESLYEL